MATWADKWGKIYHKALPKKKGAGAIPILKPFEEFDALAKLPVWQGKGGAYKEPEPQVTFANYTEETVPWGFSGTIAASALTTYYTSSKLIDVDVGAAGGSPFPVQAPPPPPVIPHPPASTRPEKIPSWMATAGRPGRRVDV